MRRFMDFNYATQNKQLGHSVIFMDVEAAELRWGTKVKTAAEDVTRLPLQ